MLRPALVHLLCVCIGADSGDSVDSTFSVTSANWRMRYDIPVPPILPTDRLCVRYRFLYCTMYWYWKLIGHTEDSLICQRVPHWRLHFRCYIASLSRLKCIGPTWFHAVKVWTVDRDITDSLLTSTYFYSCCCAKFGAPQNLTHLEILLDTVGNDDCRKAIIIG